MAPGSTVNVQITVKPRNEGTLNNTATITGGQWDPATGNSSASVNGLPAVKQVDLSVQKTAAPEPDLRQPERDLHDGREEQQHGARRDGRRAHRLAARLDEVRLRDDESGLAHHAARRVERHRDGQHRLARNRRDGDGDRDGDATAAGAITNTATVTGNESDPVAANNTASATTTVNAVNLAEGSAGEAGLDGRLREHDGQRLPDRPGSCGRPDRQSVNDEPRGRDRSRVGLHPGGDDGESRLQRDDHAGRDEAGGHWSTRRSGRARSRAT
jgi:hypothetical protein